MNSELNWSARPAPALARTAGRYVCVEPAVFPDAAEILFPAVGGAENADLWTYIAMGPFAAAKELGEDMRRAGEGGGWKTHLFRDAATGAPLGMASYMRIRPEAASSGRISW